MGFGSTEEAEGVDEGPSTGLATKDVAAVALGLAVVGKARILS